MTLNELPKYIISHPWREAKIFDTCPNCEKRNWNKAEVCPNCQADCKYYLPPKK